MIRQALAASFLGFAQALMIQEGNQELLAQTTDVEEQY